MIERPEFTDEQIDYVCYVIGEWYLDWKECITQAAPGQPSFIRPPHRLGYAKEKLKEMLFPIRELSEEKSVL